MLSQELTTEQFRILANVKLIFSNILRQTINTDNGIKTILNFRVASKYFKELIDNDPKLQKAMMLYIMQALSEARTLNLARLPFELTPLQEAHLVGVLRSLETPVQTLKKVSSEEENVGAVKMFHYVLPVCLVNPELPLSDGQPLTVANKLLIVQAVLNRSKRLIQNNSGSVDVGAQEQAINSGMAPELVQGLWFTNSHWEALQQGVPYHMIRKLTRLQLKAMQIAKEPDDKRVRKYALKEEHIRALEHGVSLDVVLQHFYKPHLIPDYYTELQQEGIKIGFTNKDVKSEWFSSRHVEAVKDQLSFVQYTVKEVRGLTEDHLSLVNRGFDLTQVLSFTEAQIEKLKGSGLSVETFNRIGIEVIDKNTILFLKALEKGECDPADLLKLNDCELQKIAYQNYSLERINKEVSGKELTTRQQFLMEDRPRLTFEQVKSLYDFQAIALSNDDSITVEEVSKEWYTPLHTFALICGLKYSEISGLNGQEVFKLLNTPLSSFKAQQSQSQQSNSHSTISSKPMTIQFDLAKNDNTTTPEATTRHDNHLPKLE